MPESPLSVNHLLALLEVALSTDTSSTEDPSEHPITSFHLLSAFIHTCLVSVGFELQQINNSEFHQDDPKAVPLPADWAASEEYVSLVYTHPHSTMHFAVKSIKMWDELTVCVRAREGGEGFVFRSDISKFITPGASLPTPGSDKARISSLFVGAKVPIADFVHRVKDELIQRMVPDLMKDEYEESAYAEASQDLPIQAPRQRASYSDHGHDQGASDIQQPTRPFAMDDPHQVGGSDVDPFGRNPLGGIGPTLGPGGGKEGMLVGPDHPMFGEEGVGGPSAPHFGGPSPLPPGAVPPGARFDPIGPFDPQGGLSDFGVGRGRGRGRGSGHPFSGEPDNDELQPPGYDNFYM